MNRILGTLDVPPQQIPPFSKVQPSIKACTCLPRWKSGKLGENLLMIYPVPMSLECYEHLNICNNDHMITACYIATIASLATKASMDSLPSVECEESVPGVNHCCRATGPVTKLTSVTTYSSLRSKCRSASPLGMASPLVRIHDFDSGCPCHQANRICGRLGVVHESLPLLQGKPIHPHVLSLDCAVHRLPASRCD